MNSRMRDYLVNEQSTESHDPVESRDVLIPAGLNNSLSQDIQIRIISVAHREDDEKGEENFLESNRTVVRSRTNSERVGLFCCSLIAFALAGGLGYGGYLAVMNEREHYNNLSPTEQNDCRQPEQFCSRGWLWLGIVAFGVALCCVAGGGVSFRESMGRDERRLPVSPNNNRFFRARSPSPSVPDWEDSIAAEPSDSMALSR